MPRRIVIDPQFRDELRRLRGERGLSTRALGKIVSYSHTYLWELEAGRKEPTPELARHLDEALVAHGSLAALVQDATVLDPDRLARVSAAEASGRHLDRTTVECLGDLLAGQRRMEDAVGARAVLRPVMSQLAAIEQMVSDARGEARTRIVDQAAQWAQFAGWLHCATGRGVAATRWFDRALLWATEANNIGLLANVFSYKGYMAWLAHRPGPTIDLSRMARQHRSVHPTQRLFDAYQEAAGHALAGDEEMVDRTLGDADELTAEALESTDPLPPWSYYHDLNFMDLQRGVVLQRLGRHQEAINVLAGAIASMPPDFRRSEWAGAYAIDLARSLKALDEINTAEEYLQYADDIADATHSSQLHRQVFAVRTELSG